jgi:hypothetical protein
MENVSIFYGLLAYFMAILYMLWPFGIFYDYLVPIFFRFGMLYVRKIWQFWTLHRGSICTVFSLAPSNVWFGVNPGSHQKTLILFNAFAVIC